jgi:hypothetical protein
VCIERVDINVQDVKPAGNETDGVVGFGMCMFEFLNDASVVLCLVRACRES